MKKIRIYFLLAIGFATGSVFTACKQSSEIKVEDAKKDLEDAQEDLLEARMKYDDEWIKFRNECNEKIRNNEKEISRFKEKVANSSDKDKKSYKEEIELLESKNKQLQMKLDNYASAKENDKIKDKWEEFRREFKHDMDELATSLKVLSKDNVK
ncbi:MAG: hypothetical protein HYU68_15420 [Bacteroidetes bacterium]|nr:hypothetical protein [Bacteroidota bacterium]